MKNQQEENQKDNPLYRSTIQGMHDITQAQVPIRRGCSNGSCFCTGACQEIIGYETKKTSSLIVPSQPEPAIDLEKAAEEAKWIKFSLWPPDMVGKKTMVFLILTKDEYPITLGKIKWYGADAEHIEDIKYI